MSPIHIRYERDDLADLAFRNPHARVEGLGAVPDERFAISITSFKPASCDTYGGMTVPGNPRAPRVASPLSSRPSASDRTS